jgi:hypothetical protein
VYLRALHAAEPAPATIVIDDKGRQAAAADVSGRVNRGEAVLAANLLFTGDRAPADASDLTKLIAALGDRPLGLEVAQLLALADWLRERSGGPVRVEASGIRSQIAALAAAALSPDLFSQVAVHGGIHSLGDLLDKPVLYSQAPDVFCLDLFRYFDIDRLQAMAAATAR